MDFELMVYSILVLVMIIALIDMIISVAQQSFKKNKSGDNRNGGVGALILTSFFLCIHVTLIKMIIEFIQRNY